MCAARQNGEMDRVEEARLAWQRAQAELELGGWAGGGPPRRAEPPAPILRRGHEGARERPSLSAKFARGLLRTRLFRSSRSGATEGSHALVPQEQPRGADRALQDGGC